jgi:hypothetical protein
MVITDPLFRDGVACDGRETGKPDFSDVQGVVKSTAPDTPPKADFSDVQSRVGSSGDVATTHTVVAGDTCRRSPSTSMAMRMRGSGFSTQTVTS